MIKQAMILAAGLGERMLPLTKNLPKPLVKIKNKSLLEHNIEKVLKNNFEKIVINTHHLSNKILKATEKFEQKVKVVVEAERLETGGGVLNCLKKEYLDFNSPILLINGDIFWEDNFYSTIQTLKKNWNGNCMDIILCMIERDKLFGYDGLGDFDFLFKKKNMGELILSNKPKYVYTGVQILNPKILRNKRKERFSLREIIHDSVKKKKVYGSIDKNLWFHIGTIKNLELARALLK